jgi:hypothetical protein
MDKLLKGSLAIGALLAGFGVFYHYVFFIPTVEREKQERVQAQQRETEEAKLTEQREKEEARRAAEASRRAAYDACLGAAREKYLTSWASACRAVAKDKNTRLKNCLNDKAVVENRYMGANWCHANHGNADASPNCSLPSSRARTDKQIPADRRYTVLGRVQIRPMKPSASHAGDSPAVTPNSSASATPSKRRPGSRRRPAYLSKNRANAATATAATVCSRRSCRVDGLRISALGKLVIAQTVGPLGPHRGKP